MKNVIDNIQAILFDMDGTLVTSIAAVDRAWSAWAIKNNLPVSDVLKYIHGKPARDSIKHFTPHLNSQIEEQWMLERELGESEGVESIKGARAFLESLAALPWAIVTSADRSLAHHRLGLAKLKVPELLITINDVKNGKPDPEGYLMAAQRLGVSPSKCVVFEDTPAGLEAGRRAGMKLMGITTTYDSQSLATPNTFDHYDQISFDKNGNFISWKTS